MSARVTKVGGTHDSVMFTCPGCGDRHVVPVTGEVAWGWNGTLDKPTITPSIAIRSGHYASNWKPGDECWCGKDYGFECYVCHSNTTDGRITFHPDSTHKLAGQTVDLPEVA